jgi:hypothetical protein
MDLLGVADKFKQSSTGYWKADASSLHDFFVPFTKLLFPQVMSHGDHGYHRTSHLEHSNPKDY